MLYNSLNVKNSNICSFALYRIFGYDKNVLKAENKYFSLLKLINKSYSPRTALDLITLNASNKNFSNKNTYASPPLRTEACKNQGEEYYHDPKSFSCYGNIPLSIYQ